jgi:hypothetical protein
MRGSPFKVVLIFDKVEKNHLNTPSKKELLNTNASFHSKVKVCQMCQTRHKMSGRPIWFTTLNQKFFKIGYNFNLLHFSDTVLVQP